MKKILNAFSKEKLQKVLFLGLIVLVFGVFILSLVLSGNDTTKNTDPNSDLPNDSSDGPQTDIKDDPIVEPKVEIYLAPCDTTTTSVFRHFYSIDSDTTTQEMSLIQYGSKYIMSKGTTYRNEEDETFDVLASLSGTVTEVTPSSVYGNTIVIDHGDGIKTEYLGVKDVLVEVGDTVAQGAVIASSGTAEYDTAAANHLHFRIVINDKYYDPEKLINTSKVVK